LTNKAIDKPHLLIRERALYRRNLTSRTATLHVRINPLKPYYSNKLPLEGSTSIVLDAYRKISQSKIVHLSDALATSLMQF